MIDEYVWSINSGVRAPSAKVFHNWCSPLRRLKGYKVIIMCDQRMACTKIRKIALLQPLQTVHQVSVS